jgi:hypothetical protein
LLQRIIPTFAKTLIDLWDNILVIVVANIIWAVSLAPAFLIGQAGLPTPYNIFAVAAALAIFCGPTTIGLYVLTSEVEREERLELGQFFAGIRQYYQRGWLLILLNLAFSIFAYFNIAFYTAMDFPLKAFSIAWIWVIFFWFMLQIYLWPMAIRLEGKLQVRLLFRNALLATFKYLGFTLIIGLIMAIGLIGSIVALLLPTVIVGMTLQAMLSNNMLREVLKKERERENITSSDNPNEN